LRNKRRPDEAVRPSIDHARRPLCVDVNDRRVKEFNASSSLKSVPQYTSPRNMLSARDSGGSCKAPTSSSAMRLVTIKNRQSQSGSSVMPGPVPTIRTSGALERGGGAWPHHYQPNTGAMPHVIRPTRRCLLPATSIIPLQREPSKLPSGLGVGTRFCCLIILVSVMQLRRFVNEYRIFQSGEILKLAAETAKEGTSNHPVASCLLDTRAPKDATPHATPSSS